MPEANNTRDPFMQAMGAFSVKEGATRVVELRTNRICKNQERVLKDRYRNGIYYGILEMLEAAGIPGGVRGELSNADNQSVQQAMHGDLGWPCVVADQAGKRIARVLGIAEVTRQLLREDHGLELPHLSREALKCLNEQAVTAAQMIQRVLVK